MAHIPQGPLGDPIRSKKELGEILLGVGYLFGFLSIVILVIMLYAKSYKTQKELLLMVGIPGAISLILLVLGKTFMAKKEEPRFKRPLNRRN
jgi:hypothetical protein